VGLTTYRKFSEALFRHRSYILTSSNSTDDENSTLLKFNDASTLFPTHQFHGQYLSNIDVIPTIVKFQIERKSWSEHVVLYTYGTIKKSFQGCNWKIA